MLDGSELRLLEILRKRYDCKIEVHTINTLDGEEDPDWDEKFKTMYRNRMAKFIVSGDSIIFPIYRVRDTIVCIEIANSENLQPNDLLQIKDCIELVFNDLYVLKEKKNLVKQRQTYLESQMGHASNVLPFRHRELH
ncbi:MAG: hypothetical protein KDD37_04590 [Bdellovibrionales bacterium]|nr:hypothetical protein [Bdellovibrionales bacterium]